MKIILAILVVMRHCGQGFYESVGNSIYYEAFVCGVTTVAVPTFFCISGFLFFNKTADINRLVKQIKRILALYLVWTVLYLPLDIYQYYKSGESIASCAVEYFQNLIFSGSHYHLWYLPSLIVALVVVWFLGKFFKNYQILIIAAVLYVIGTLGDSYSFILSDGLANVLAVYKGIFLTTRNGVFCGTLFVAIGKIIAQNKEKFPLDGDRNRRISNKKAIIAGIVSIVSVIGVSIESYAICEFAGNTINNMLVFDVPVAVGLVIVFLNIRLALRNEISHFFRKLSTLVFCCHPWVITIWVKLAKHVSGTSIEQVCGLSVYTLITIVICLFIGACGIALSKKIKFLKVLY